MSSIAITNLSKNNSENLLKDLTDREINNIMGSGCHKDHYLVSFTRELLANVYSSYL